MKFDGENIKKTSLSVYEYGKRRIVYITDDGRLFFKYDRRLHRTYKEYCL